MAEIQIAVTLQLSVCRVVSERICVPKCSRTTSGPKHIAAVRHAFHLFEKGPEV